MARIRTIKPIFWEDEKIGKLSIAARLMFIGTWNIADDDGILVWRPEYLRSRIFPYDDFSLEEIEKLQQELTKLKLVRRFRSRSGESYAIVVKFLHHQVINRKQKSTLPHPRWFRALTQNGCALDTKDSVNDTGIKHGCNTAESVGERKRNGREWKGREEEEEGISELLLLCKENLKDIDTNTEEDITRVVSLCSAEKVTKAVKEAVFRNKPYWSYVLAILKNWGAL